MFLVTVSAGIAAAGDPDLEPGFPVQAWHGAGSYHSGQAIHVLVGNIDADDELEILMTALSTGPVYAWNADGSQVFGWPVAGGTGVGYVALGQLSIAYAGLEAAVGYWGDELVAYAGDGSVLPGWPVSASNYISTPPALGDVDGDGLDEFFIGEEDWKLHAYRADGTVLPGWPTSGFVGGQERHTPAIADLDGDGDLEILSTSGSTSPGVYLCAYHHDGTDVAGFPVLFSSTGGVDSFPTVGDVDGDGEREIVIALKSGMNGIVYVLSPDGSIERTLLSTGSFSYSSAVALADLDGDRTPEIILQTEGQLDVWKGDGSVFPGWPVMWSTSHWLGNSSPVVGDVDGDADMEIVVTSQVAGSSANGWVYVYNSDGTLHPSFPKSLPIGSGAVPAIADIDLDGRNEIIIGGSYWNGVLGNYDKVWAYDLGGGPHGRVEWSQFGGNARHTGVYVPATIPGDLDGDGDVDQADLGILLAAYGINDSGDCDGDGDTDQADLGILLANYGAGT